VSPAQYDIAVVGGGPVGAAAALALHTSGFKVALIERSQPPVAYDSRTYDIRVYAIAPQSMALLDRLGVWPRIAAARVSPYRHMQVWVEQADRALCFSAADAGRNELGWIVEHGLIVDALWSALDGVAVYAPAGIEPIQFNDGLPPVLQFDDGRSLQARLLIAADGANSSLRHAAGIDTIGWAYSQRAIVCHVKTAQPHRHTAWQRFLRSGPLAFLPLADDRCSIVWSADEALADELMALDDVTFRARLGATLGSPLGAIVEATPRISLPLRLLHARDYVRPGLALIGDAAHTVHPLAGQGVNLGFADIETLVAELTAARDKRRDWSGIRTLQRYARARKSANLDMLAVTDGLYRLFKAPVPGLRTLLGVGIDGVDQLAPLKSWLARQATGG